MRSCGGGDVSRVRRRDVIGVCYDIFAYTKQDEHHKRVVNRIINVVLRFVLFVCI